MQLETLSNNLNKQLFSCVSYLYTLLTNPGLRFENTLYKKKVHISEFVRSSAFDLCSAERQRFESQLS